MFKPHYLSTLIALVCATAAHAEENFRQHEAHVHGHVEMNIAQDGHDLLLEITAPGMDVVGFEHEPQTENEHQQIDQAVALLKDANQLITINSAADCHLESATVHHPEGEEEEHEDHEGHDHEDHDHDADAHEDEHADHDHDADEHEHQHSEFSIEYAYHCEQIEKLESIDTAWFKHFTHTNEIDVNIFTEKSQTSTELTAQDSQLKL